MARVEASDMESKEMHRQSVTNPSGSMESKEMHRQSITNPSDSMESKGTHHQLFRNPSDSMESKGTHHQSVRNPSDSVESKERNPQSATNPSASVESKERHLQSVTNPFDFVELKERHGQSVTNPSDSVESKETHRQAVTNPSGSMESKEMHHQSVANPSDSMDHANMVDKGEDEGDVCRICRNPGEIDAPLCYPCACSGSIKYVHQDCLLQWLNHSNIRKCEVCKHAFSFSPVYAENAPVRLPFKELVLGMAVKTIQGMHFSLRLAFVLSVWLLFIPLTTFWIWQLSLVRSFAEAQRLFRSHFSPALFLNDCLHGFLLSAGIVFIFLGATSLREYIRYLRELGAHDAEREDDGAERQLGPRARRRGPQGQAALGDRLGPGDGVGADLAGGNGEAAAVGQGLAAGAGQLIRRNAENVAARLEMQAARLEALEQIFDGADDVDGAEDVPFDELVGMQGPVFHLVENAITVLASNAIFLGLVTFLPFTLGRIILSILSRLLISGSASGKLAPVLSNDGVFYLNDTNVSKSLLSDGVFLSVFSVKGNGSIGDMFVGIGEDMFSSFGNNTQIERSFNAFSEATVMSIRLSDSATVAVGYSVILVAASIYIGLIALIKYIRGETLIAGRFHGVASIAEVAPSVMRQAVAGVKYILTMFKVAFLLLIELGVFPLMCGWWLDICTLGMLGATVGNRVAFFWTSPFTSSLLHWLVGVVYMLQISIFVSLLREVLRPGVLYFLRDPADPNYNPFRDLIDDPIHKHARRVLLSAVVYGSLIVMLIFLPIQVAMSLAPKLFPLDIKVSDPFTEIPADILLFHICIPFAIEHFRTRATIKTALFHWFSLVGWALGLSKFLLPGPEEKHDLRQGARRDENQARLPAAQNDGQRHVVHAHVGTGAVQELDIDDQAAPEYGFVMRIVLLLIGAWLTLFAFNSAMVLLPVSLGRAIFSCFSHLPVAYGVKCNDLYAFNLGFYVIWATAAVICYVMDYLNSHDLKVLLMQFLKWSAIVSKSFLLLSLWIVVIPVLIGLLFELLVVVPLRVPIDESPVFLLYQDWALGLVFLKIWSRLIMLGQVTPLADESWRTKFEQVRTDGFSRLRGLWVFREIVAPILVKLLTALCVPYVFARGLFPILGYSLLVNSAVYRFSWSGCLMVGAVWYGVRRIHCWTLELHNSIRDDRYLIGKRLHNYGENKIIPSILTQHPSGNTSESTTESLVLPSDALALQESDVSANGNDIVEDAGEASSNAAGALQ